ncbi:hypothetical protein KEM48_010243 [Puccinia striiformis f. sp. tritici PST-130]|nr:hypothetical protein KEM48_010243 [Puccinia striiformis f. sp. tritici PST-130]
MTTLPQAINWNDKLSTKLSRALQPFYLTLSISRDLRVSSLSQYEIEQSRGSSPRQKSFSTPVENFAMSENWGGGVKGSSCSGPTVEDYYAMAEREGRSSGPQTYSQTSSSSSHQPTYRSGWNFERLFIISNSLLLPHSHSIALRLSLASLWSIVTSTALEKSSSQIRYTIILLHTILSYSP